MRLAIGYGVDYGYSESEMRVLICYAIVKRGSVVVLEAVARSWFPERCVPRLEEFGFWFPRIVVS
jgi:hypothetical protein